jgi:hypothetical protein
MGQDSALQEALSPRLKEIGRRRVQRAGYPIHIDLHVGRLSSQVKPRLTATSPRIILGIIHLSAKNTREPRRTPGAKKNDMEALTDLYKPTFSVWGPTGHVIYSRM